VIPVNGQKKPLVAWTPYQTRKAGTEEITTWWKEWPGARIGIVTGVVSGLLVVDVDSKEGEEKINELLPDTLLTPACQTPRGGKHLYFACSDSRVGNATGILPGVDVRANGGYVVAPPSKGYSWLAGLAIGEIIPLALEGLPESLLSLINNKRYSFNTNISNNKVFNNIISSNTINNPVTSVTSVTSVTNFFTHQRRNDDLFHLAYSLLKGGARGDFALQVMERIRDTFNPEDPPVSYDELKTTLKSAKDRFERKDRNVASEVEAWINETALVTSSYFFVTSCYSELHLLQKEEKAAARVALHRMLNKKIVTGSKRGEYRILDKNVTKVDLKAPTLPRFDLKWPLKLEEIVYLNPKSIVIVAGETNAGKSTFVFDFAGRNKDKYKIHLWNTEMSSEDIADRLIDYGEGLDFWEDVDIIVDRTENFEDVIYPDDINIIDYLSVNPDQIWKIKTPIDNIFNKLNKGIAIICLQMGKGQEMPYGRSWGVERSRLAIALKHKRELGNFAEIIKGKNWVNKKKKPDGLVHKFFFLGSRVEGMGFWSIPTKREEEF